VTYQQVPSLYHADRYSYIFSHILNDQTIYFPLTKSLTLKDFILLRSVPIGFIGIESQSTFIDGDFNSPLDCFLHDMHHFRRQIGHNNLYLARTNSIPEDMIELFDQTIKKVEPFISWDQSTPKKERQIRQILELLYFELWHEFGFTPDEDSIKSAFLFQSKQGFANEYMSSPWFDHQKLESYRLPNFLLKSGFSSFRPGYKPLVINYFLDQGPHFLTSAYNKAIHGFYDYYANRSEDLPDLKSRTQELFFLAAKRLLAIHGFCEIISDQTLEELLRIKGPLETYLNENLVIPTKI
jgi:hypothetical protein